MASEKIIMYSIACPQCKLLEKKFNELGIEYELENVKDDTEKLGEAIKIGEEAGIKSFPFVKVNDKYMNFGEALKWAKGAYKNEN